MAKTPDDPAQGASSQKAPGQDGASGGGHAKKRQRLDVALVERGLEASRERARRLIVAGEVTVNGLTAQAPSTLVAPDATLAIGKALPYVSRGGLKLAHALDRFGIDPAGRTCLDAGASTGGFTDVLLQRGASRVYAADVGKGLLAWTLRQDHRVIVMEGVNVRSLKLPESASLAVADLAFISLRLVLPALADTLTGNGDLVTLVKPQFEAGRADVGKGGVIRNPAIHRRVLHEVLAAIRTVHLAPAGLTASPIRGQAGNVEFLLWSRRAAAPQFEDDAAVEQAIAEGTEAAA